MEKLIKIPKQIKVFSLLSHEKSLMKEKNISVAKKSLKMVQVKNFQERTWIVQIKIMDCNYLIGIRKKKGIFHLLSLREL